MRIAVGDVDEKGMAETKRLLHAELPQATYWTHTLDVSKLENVQAFADAVFKQFGAVHVLCNNAGVAVNGPLWQSTENDWKWVMGVNLLGVAWGIKAFVPRMIAQGEGHIVNTASAAGWAYMPNLGVYNVTKSGVVAMSETLIADLRGAGSQLGVTVVCPSFFRTAINSSGRNRPEHLADAHHSTEAEARAQREEAVNAAFDSSPVSAKDVAELTLQAVHDRRFYVFPHQEIKDFIQVRAKYATSDRNPPGV
jgi:NAD(P)-dependent dehydrogenase (short-subunit alcohol dehydrogenase family)